MERERERERKSENDGVEELLPRNCKNRFSSKIIIFQ